MPFPIEMPPLTDSPPDESLPKPTKTVTLQDTVVPFRHPTADDRKIKPKIRFFDAPLLEIKCFFLPVLDGQDNKYYFCLRKDLDPKDSLTVRNVISSELQKQNYTIHSWEEWDKKNTPPVPNVLTQTASRSAIQPVGSAHSA